MAFGGCVLVFAHVVFVFALVVQLHQACVARPVALRGLRGFVVPERDLCPRLVGLGIAKGPGGVAAGVGLHRHWPGKRLLVFALPSG